MTEILNELPYAVLIFVIPFCGLMLSNYALDAGVSFTLSRKIGHLCGGIPYFLSPLLFTSVFWPLLISATYTIILLAARLWQPSQFRGVGGISRPEQAAEVTYPLGGTICLAVGWLWLGKPWVAVVPVLMMAWGDGISGMVRYLLRKGEQRGLKSAPGTFAFFSVSLLIALPIQPYWLGIIAALGATLAETTFGPKAIFKVEDNLPIQLVALGILCFS